MACITRCHAVFFFLPHTIALPLFPLLLSTVLSKEVQWVSLYISTGLQTIYDHQIDYLNYYCERINRKYCKYCGKSCEFLRLVSHFDFSLSLSLSLSRLIHKRDSKWFASNCDNIKRECVSMARKKRDFNDGIFGINIY